MNVLYERFASLPMPGLETQLTLERGGWKDYQTLEAHHYKAQRPATATRILVLRHAQPSVIDRFRGNLAHSQTKTTVAVLVESLPSLSCRMRDVALGKRYGSMIDAWQRAQVLNEEVRCISRVIVHPQWRGLGLAHRLVREALQTATTLYTEALAAMGRVNPFFTKAGMTAYPRPSHAQDARLIAAMQHVGLQPTDLALLDLVQRHLEQMPENKRHFVLGELGRWYRNHHGRGQRYESDPSVHWRMAQMKLLAEPVYYLHDNRPTMIRSPQ
ncbi:MAG: hypothetical protein HC898_12590 [Phycisphaerales bacterium]|nr:hypothetical protein [Phycisphaerales bacterium]